MKYNLSAIQQLVLKNNANLFVILLPMKPDMEIFIENKKNTKINKRTEGIFKK